GRTRPGSRRSPPQPRLDFAALPARRKYSVVRSRRRRRTHAQRRLFWQRTLIVAALAALAAMALGLAFAGSPSRLAGGVRIAGVDVGGKTPHQARSILERRAGMLASTPVTFRVGSRTWRLEPRHLGIRVDWGAAVDAVRRQGNGFGPLRGFRRLDLRFFGADVAPPTQVYDAALDRKLDQIAAAVNVPHREAALELPPHGRPELRTGAARANSWFSAVAKRVDRAPVDADWAVGKGGIRVIPDQPGYVLDVPRSAQAVLRAALVTEPALRNADLTVERVSADRTTAEAEAMDINGLVASYQTFYGGEPNRIHNVQLVSHLVDKHVI